MRLSELLESVEHTVIAGSTDRRVRFITQDSREVGPEGVFVALRGRTVDGHDFVPEIRADVVVVERATSAPPGVTVVKVRDGRDALAKMASRLYGDPSDHLDIIGVTGTNGKTTTTWMIESICEAAGRRVGVIGTTGHRVAGVPVPSAFTTPTPVQWHSLLARMARAGCEVVAAEVSSIGLAERRVDGTRFRIAVYTNLSQDHLDYHGSMSAYAAAKGRLFGALLQPDGVAVLNAEDPATNSLPTMGTRIDIRTYGLELGEVTVGDLEMDASGSRGRITVLGGGEQRFELSLVGRHNVLNALAAAAACLALGVDLASVARGLAALPVIPGRLEPVPNDRGVGVLVDYAHTPDALRVVLASLRELSAGRILLVFGCGGQRDQQKRPLMGEAASEGADLVVVTSDNPRGEDPMAIIDAIRPGLRGEVRIEPDRRRAIALALGLAQPGDIVLIAGKGHEKTQILAEGSRPFDDRLVAAELLGGD